DRGVYRIRTHGPETLINSPRPADHRTHTPSRSHVRVVAHLGRRAVAHQACSVDRINAKSRRATTARSRRGRKRRSDRDHGWTTFRTRSLELSFDLDGRWRFRPDKALSLRTNMSAGQLFDLIMPAAFTASAFISTWVLT